MKKTDLINSVIRAASNAADSGETLTRDIELFVDNGFKSDGSDPITDSDLIDFGLTYADFAKAKTYSDAYNAFLALNSREMDIILNKLRRVI